jgi:type IV pilus assembly protein PilX
MNMNKFSTKRHQGGAVLVVSLILLVIITILAVSGMNTATTEIAMARNNQNSENAFQAAESGLELALSQGLFNTTGLTTLTQSVSTNETVTTDILFEDSTFVPDRAFSMGVGSGISAYHFTAVATADSLRSPGTPTDRDASAVHSQAFYIVGPESPAL